MNITKKSKYGIVITIIIFFIILVIAFISSVEINMIYEKVGENTYIAENIKQIQPFNYNTDVVQVWFIGFIIISISMYVAFIKRKEKDINKAQRIILAVIIPIIIVVGFLATIQLFDIYSIIKYAWFPTVITLMIIAAFEYDLFGNKTIISFFDPKLLTKVIILSIVLFIIIGILGELIPPFTKTIISPITENQYEQYEGKKFDWSQFKPPTKITE